MQRMATTLGVPPTFTKLTTPSLVWGDDECLESGESRDQPVEPADCVVHGDDGSQWSRVLLQHTAVTTDHAATAVLTTFRVVKRGLHSACTAQQTPKAINN